MYNKYLLSEEVNALNLVYSIHQFVMVFLDELTKRLNINMVLIYFCVKALSYAN